MKRIILICSFCLYLSLSSKAHAMLGEVLDICDTAINAREFITTVIQQMNKLAATPSLSSSDEFKPKTTIPLSETEDSRFLITINFQANKSELEQQQAEFDQLLKNAYPLFSGKYHLAETQDFLRQCLTVASKHIEPKSPRSYDISTACFVQLERHWKQVKDICTKGLEKKKRGNDATLEERKQKLLPRMIPYVGDIPSPKVTRSNSGVSSLPFGFQSLKRNQSRRQKPLSARGTRPNTIDVSECAKTPLSAREGINSPILIGHQRSKSEEDLSPDSIGDRRGNAPHLARPGTFNWAKQSEVF